MICQINPSSTQRVTGSAGREIRSASLSVEVGQALERQLIAMHLAASPPGGAKAPIIGPSFDPTALPMAS